MSMLSDNNNHILYFDDFLPVSALTLTYFVIY